MIKDYLKFRQYTNRHKLSQNSVTSILQDREGFMWFATQDGLNRYDGCNFKIYKKNSDDVHSLSDNFLNFLYEDKTDDIIWIGSYNSGLIMYDKLNDTFIKKKSMELIENEFITSTIEDGENNLWIGTFHRGLFKYNRIKDTLEEINLDLLFETDRSDKKGVMCLQFDKIKNKMYVGIWKSGLYIIDLEGNLNELYQADSKKENQILSNNITILFLDNIQNLWIGTDSGLSKYSISKKSFTHYLHSNENRNSITGNSINDICQDSEGNLWIGAWTGLSKYSYSSDSFLNFTTKEDRESGFVCDAIFCLYYDRSDVLWLGTLAEGIIYLDTKQKKFYSIINSDNDFKEDERNKITSVLTVNKNNVLIGTFRDGLYNYKNEYGIKSFSKYPHIGKDTIYQISEGDAGDYWTCGRKSGLCKINLSNNKAVMFDVLKDGGKSHIMNYCKSNSDEDVFLLGTKYEGVIIFDKKNNVILVENIFKDFKGFEVKSIYIDSNNNLWISTNPKGLILFRDIYISKEKIVLGNHVTLDCGNTVWCTYEDNEKNIWTGTASDGLMKISSDKIITERYTENNGLCSNCVLGILEDENTDLWLSTTNGLSRFNKINKTFKNYDTTDGINNSEFNDGAYYKHKDGTMYFGGNDGITYFKPEEITDNPYIPNIVFTDFQIFNTSIKCSPENPFLKTNIPYAKQISLSHIQSVFSFEFAALIFNNPQKNQYAYRMEGFDDDWVYCGTRRTATYTNLDPGEYTFRVKGSNNDGLWNEEGTSIKIIITPPWYKTIMFKGLVGLSVIGSIGSFYRQRIQKLNKEKIQQEEFTKKLIESQENERKRVAAELHDSLGQDLLIIKNKALISIKKNEPEKLLEQMNEISELTSATLNEVREISYNLRPYELDRLGLTKTISSMIERANSSTNINFTGNIEDIDKVFIPEVEINIYRIIQESLNNVIKHSEAKEVIVSVLKKEKEILINISDDGKGFDMRKYNMNSKKKGFGLKGIEERVRLLNGEFSIESEVGKGTVLEIQLAVSS